jgi:hypothetical protein
MRSYRGHGGRHRRTCVPVSAGRPSAGPTALLAGEDALHLGDVVVDLRVRLAHRPVAHRERCGAGILEQLANVHEREEALERTGRRHEGDPQCCDHDDAGRPGRLRMGGLVLAHPGAVVRELIIEPVPLLNSSDTEVYGPLKEGAAFNHRGQRSYDSQVATWAERRRVLAAELRSGNLAEQPTAIKVLRRALKSLPDEHGRVWARMDSDFESAAIFKELRRQEVSFTCSLRRTPALHRLRLEIASRAWRPALLMPQTEIAETPTRPRAGGRSRCA